MLGKNRTKHRSQALAQLELSSIFGPPQPDRLPADITNGIWRFSHLIDGHAGAQRNVALISVGGGIVFGLDGEDDADTFQGLVTSFELSGSTIVAVRAFLLLSKAKLRHLLLKTGVQTASPILDAAYDALMPSDFSACILAKHSLRVPIDRIKGSFLVLRRDEVSEYMLNWRDIHSIKMRVLEAGLEIADISFAGTLTLRDCVNTLIGEQSCSV